MTTTLVLAAHPDDEVLGCGGTIARLAREGHAVYVAILGEGISSRYRQRDDADPALIRTLHETSRRVAALLGARDLFLFGLPDNRFDTVPLLDVVKIVEDLVARLKPEVVYTQHGGDLNIDHAVLYRATLTATRPTAGGPVRSVLAYEVASSSEWAFQKFSPAFRPSLFVDIHQTLESKVQAMGAV
jgi:LmbE family N-acetylglucosaminyl deacetylase